ncbi:MAG: M28 family peptidase [Candidatus Aminicenantes bacterium]|nr:M28 family peptidase [Candidatus Aminicenantes bacterium]
MINKGIVVALIAVSAFIFSSCAEKGHDLDAALASITADELAKNTEVLSSDKFEGRAPASKGEELTVNFLKEEFIQLGLKPGNGESFFQDVPMVEINSIPTESLAIKGSSGTKKYAFKDDFTALTLRVIEEVSLSNSEMVFVGYGIVAPEYDWNDYEGIDVKGKTVLILVNDPGFATEDPDFFTGRAMTYYGRWTYKYEEAARQGASGAFIIHETEPAAYGWGVVTNSFTGPKFNLISDDNNMSRCAVEGWLTLDASKEILKEAGQSLEELKVQATNRGFKAIPLGLTAALTMNNTIRESVSRNVIAVIPGTDRADEYIFYMAHWDHFGIDTSLEEDQIYNGALDNATGTAGLIELAKAFQKLGSPPLRSIAFLAVTGEEQGLLGSLYYATHPIYPTSKTVAAINMDALNIYGPMKDITVVGFGKSELDSYLIEAAAEQGRRVEPNPTPEKGSFYRSDHFSFAKQGVPALYAGTGNEHVEHGKDWTRAQKEKYLSENYHKTSDEFDPNWDLSGAIDDLRLLFKVGYKLSSEAAFPGWREGTEFKAVRDADLKKNE